MGAIFWILMGGWVSVRVGGMGATVFGGSSGVLMHISDTCAIRFFDLQTWLTVKRIQLWIPSRRRETPRTREKKGLVEWKEYSQHIRQ